MKLSIITVVYNRKNTIANAIKSIQEQSYSDIQHIIIDGGSTDGTLEIIEELMMPETILISEHDDGIYDAINKGIALATGEIIGLLHSDDMYASESVLSEVESAFSDPGLDAVYADAIFFKRGDPNSFIRRYRSDRFNVDALAWGWMPAHTTLFFRRRVFKRFGVYKTDYKIASDMDFIARVFKSKNFQATYVNKIWVKMQAGGISTGGWRNTILLNREVLRALRENGIKTNLAKILTKYPLKFLEYFDRVNLKIDTR